MNKKQLIVAWMMGILLLSGCATYDYALQRRQEYVNSHPKLSEDTKKCILEGKVAIGMTKDEVVASWGESYSFDKTKFVSSWGTTENWTYGNCVGAGGCTIITFFNGKVLSFYKNHE